MSDDQPKPSKEPDEWQIVDLDIVPGSVAVEAINRVMETFGHEWPDEEAPVELRQFYTGAMTALCEARTAVIIAEQSGMEAVEANLRRKTVFDEIIKIRRERDS